MRGWARLCEAVAQSDVHFRTNTLKSHTAWTSVGSSNVVAYVGLSEDRWDPGARMKALMMQ